jgi:hypothetical protein
LTDITEELRGASDALLRDLERLATLEERKRRIMPGDPDLVSLSKDIEEVAQRVLFATVHQRSLTEEVDELIQKDPGAIRKRSIEATPPRELHKILRDWRDAERRVSEASRGSEESVSALREAAWLRIEYRNAQEVARRRTELDKAGG